MDNSNKSSSTNLPDVAKFAAFLKQAGAKSFAFIGADDVNSNKNYFIELRKALKQEDISSFGFYSLEPINSKGQHRSFNGFQHTEQSDFQNPFDKIAPIRSKEPLVAAMERISNDRNTEILKGVNLDRDVVLCKGIADLMHVFSRFEAEDLKQQNNPQKENAFKEASKDVIGVDRLAKLEAAEAKTAAENKTKTSSTKSNQEQARRERNRGNFSGGSVIEQILAKGKENKGNSFVDRVVNGNSENQKGRG